jgi:hypothetical protein
MFGYHVAASGWQPSNTLHVAKNGGFKSCIVVRFRDYKWNGGSGKVHQ